MAKIDKSQYTKEEWRKIKEQRRKDKETAKKDKAVSTPVPEVKTIKKEPVLVSTEPKNYVLCLKHGHKYNRDYVNKLYNMVKRHCTLDYEFVCLTDDPTGLYPEIKTLELPSDLEGWWCKPYMFSADLPIKGNILYMDLDVVIASNIDKLFTYSPNHWCVIRDFTRHMRPKWTKYNSSVVRFKTGQLDFVWSEYKKNPKGIQKRFFGDQDWLYEATRKQQAMYWPDSWILSWKWEVRKSKEFAAGGLKGNRKFKHIENDAKPRPECCITVFHGDPNPHNCHDQWVVDNWR